MHNYIASADVIQPFVGALGPLLPPLAAQPTTPLEAALSLAAAGLPVFPSNPEGTFGKDKKTGEVIDISKKPAISRWQFQATTDPVQVRRWWGAGGRYSGCGVSIGLRLAGLVAVDPDTPEAAEILAEHGDALAVAFAIASAKGAKMLYRRPDRLADQNGAKVKAAALGGADAVMGNVLAWTPGRVWYGEPSAIGDSPPFLLTALAEIYPHRPATAPPPPRAARPAGDGDADRLTAFVRRAQEDESDQVGRLGDGRKGAMHAMGFKLAGVNWMAPHLERDARQEAERACAACGLALRVGMAHFANGWRWGLEHPRPAPAPRDLGLGALPPQERATLEARAIAAAAPDVVDLLRSAGVRAIAAHRAARASALLAGRALDRGVDTVSMGWGELRAHLGGIGASTAAKLPDQLGLLGWTVTPGGIAEDGTVTATRWTMPKTLAQRGYVQNGRVLDEGCVVVEEAPSQFADKYAVGDLARGLRGRSTAPIPGVSAAIHPVLSVLADGLEHTTRDLASATGCHPSTIARVMKAATVREATTATTATPNAARGRPATRWSMTADAVAAYAGAVAEGIGDGLRQVLDAGRSAASRAYARLRDDRQILTWARRQPEGMVAALSSLRARAAAVGGAFSSAARRFMVAATVPDDDARRRAMAEATGDLAPSLEVAAERRAVARAQLVDGAARRDWARAITTRTLVAEIGLATTW